MTNDNIKYKSALEQILHKYLNTCINWIISISERSLKYTVCTLHSIIIRRALCPLIFCIFKMKTHTLVQDEIILWLFLQIVNEFNIELNFVLFLLKNIGSFFLNQNFGNKYNLCTKIQGFFCFKKGQNKERKKLYRSSYIPNNIKPSHQIPGISANVAHVKGDHFIFR